MGNEVRENVFKEVTDLYHQLDQGVQPNTLQLCHHCKALRSESAWRGETLVGGAVSVVKV